MTSQRRLVRQRLVRHGVLTQWQDLVKRRDANGFVERGEASIYGLNELEKMSMLQRTCSPSWSVVWLNPAYLPPSRSAPEGTWDERQTLWINHRRRTRGLP